MARDDYHVIVYQILAYLYQQLKKGENVDARLISAESPMYRINSKYWKYIMKNLLNDGYIEGITIGKYIAGEEVEGLDYCMITPKGIEYLTDNSTISKAKEFFKDVKSIVPFI